jgi:hypothetical protein
MIKRGVEMINDLGDVLLLLAIALPLILFIAYGIYSLVEYLKVEIYSHKQDKYDRIVSTTTSKKMLNEIFTKSRSDKTRIIAAEKILSREDLIDFIISEIFHDSHSYYRDALKRINPTDSELESAAEKNINKLYYSSNFDIKAMLITKLNNKETLEKLYTNKEDSILAFLAAKKAEIPLKEKYIDNLAYRLLHLKKYESFEFIQYLNLTDNEIQKLGEIFGQKMREKPTSEMADKLLLVYKAIKSESFMDGLHTEGQIKYNRRITLEEHSDDHSDYHSDTSVNGWGGETLSESSDHTDSPEVYEDREEYI